MSDIKNMADYKEFLNPMSDDVYKAGLDPKIDYEALQEKILASIETEEWDEHKDTLKFDLAKCDDELKSHPFFMNPDHIPTQEEIDASPELLAMQALKYDTDVPYDEATNFKEDGNEHFKRKLYKKAILAYSSGLHVRCRSKPIDETSRWTVEDLEGLIEPTLLNAQLACNRAVSNFHIKNYRSCVKDCAISVKFYKTHMKAYKRACLALEKIDQFQEMKAWAQYGLKIDPANEELKKLLQTAISKYNVAHRNFRKKQVEKKKVQKEKAKISALIQSRLYPYTFSKDYIKKMVQNVNDEHCNVTEDTDSWLLTLISPLVTNRVTVVKEESETAVASTEKELYPAFFNDFLTFPVLFLYPQYKTTDLVEKADERCFLSDLVGEMFSDRPDWDENHDYNPVDIDVFYFNRKTEKYAKINTDNPMGTIMADIVIEDGMINFTILSKRSQKFYKEFLAGKYDE